MVALPFTIHSDTDQQNGDLIIRDAHGRLVALIYRGFGRHGEEVAKARADAFVAAVQPAWCGTCGHDTALTDECPSCVQWWIDNAPDARATGGAT